MDLGEESRLCGSGEVVAVAPQSGMHSASPWWFLTNVKEASEANVAEVMFKVNNVAGVDPVASRSPISAVAEGLVTEEVRTTVVMIPVLINKCALAAGTVLKRFVREQPSKAREAKPITVARVAKKAKLPPSLRPSA